MLKMSNVEADAKIQLLVDEINDISFVQNDCWTILSPQVQYTSHLAHFFYISSSPSPPTPTASFLSRSTDS